MIAFIDEHRAVYGVEPICRVLPIAPSTYYAHVARRADSGKLPARARSDATLKIEIRRDLPRLWWTRLACHSPLGLLGCEIPES
jgi:hypothetical protein